MKPSSTSPTIDAAALRTSLSPVLPILDAFNHRNKNQHRASHWWSHFSILRRSVKAILSCPSRQDALLPRVRWLKDRIVPRVYVYDPSKPQTSRSYTNNVRRPFTQLTADNQYATLGLLLLGVLAQINTTLVEVLPQEPDSTPVPTLETSKATPAVAKGTDKGTAISRVEFTRPKATATPDTHKPNESAAKRPADDQETLIPQREKKKKKAADDSDPAAPQKKKKKKPKSKGDDAFSSMFGSL